jgi:hypothetical protein
MLRDGVDCAVRLLSAQHSIRIAEQRSDAAEQAKQTGVAELNALFDNVQNATNRSMSEGMDRTVRAAAQVVAGARGVMDAAIRDLEAQAAVDVGQSAHIVDKARETMSSAIGQFLEQHTAPDSRLCLQLMASPEANAGHATIITPYGVSAVFGVAVPPGHAWARPRRVADFSPQLEVQMPQESGWISKRVEMAPVRLERLIISDVMYGERSGVLRLRKAPGSGPGYQLRVDLESGVNLSMSPVRDDGSLSEEQPFVLEGNDQASMLGLWQSVVQSSWDLMHLRRRMVSAAFGERPLLELDSPRTVAEALIANLAPVVVEISRRSGAPGELVLRRNLGEGRREETYCTHAELLEKICVLPPDLRAVFSPFNLAGLSAASSPQAHGGATSSDVQPPDSEDQEPFAPSASSPFNGSSEHLSKGAAHSGAGRPPSVPPPESSPPPA